jgi:hypothetical protein
LWELETLDGPAQLVGINAFTVVGADELVAPGAECRQAEAAEGGLPCLQELRIRGPDPQLDPAALAAGRSIAASAFVTSSGMICERSIPACAKFSRK